jgi:hypothetical protein
VNAVSAESINAADEQGNSSFFAGVSESDLFSERFPAAICLQSWQGCLPSKVFCKASEMGKTRA